MAAAQKKFFKRNNQVSSRDNKESSLADLKDQLSSIHTKIEEIEGNPDENEFEVKTLYQWASASHVFIPRGKRWLTYVVLITLLIILVLLFLREFIIIAPVLAVAFLAYILASVPPGDIEHKITNQGVISGKRDYLWEELYDFWFTEKHGHTILNIDTLVRFPGRLVLIVDAKDKDEVKNTILKYIPYREIPKTNWLDSLGDSLSNIFHKLASQ